MGIKGKLYAKYIKSIFHNKITMFLINKLSVLSVIVKQDIHNNWYLSNDIHYLK